MTAEGEIDTLNAWLTKAGLRGESEAALVSGFCERVVAAGLPLSRALVLIDTLHPVYEGRLVRWGPDPSQPVVQEPARRSAQASRSSYALRSELVAKFAQHLLARFDVGLGFDSLALDAIDNAENSSPVPGVGHDDFYRIGRRAVDGANLWHTFDGVKDIDRETAGHEDNETMSATQRQGVLLRELDEFRVVSSPTNQGGPT